MGIGLTLTALALGLRHGVDWDHIAAIADLSSAAETRRRGFLMALLYALGHAGVVLALGTLAIFFGASLPDAVDTWMGRVVGLTLVALGAWVLIELARRRRDFRLRSRFMLVLDGTFAGFRRVRAARGRRRIHVEHEHDHEHDPGGGPHGAVQAHDHAHVPVEAVAAPVLVGANQPHSRTTRRLPHIHRHGHDLVVADVATARYGKGTATAIGVAHGVGVESPTQIAAFVASTTVVGVGSSFALLFVWILGLVIANSLLAVAAGFGVLQVERYFWLYAGLAIVVAVASIVIGVGFVFGVSPLPAL